MKNCPEQSELVAFAQAQLPDDQTAEISRHVQQCDACRSTVDRFAGTLATIARRKDGSNGKLPRQDSRDDAKELTSPTVSPDGSSDHSSQPQRDDTDVTVANTVVGKSAKANRPGTGATPVRLLGDYELFEEIARGGMGVVWRARQRRLNRIVAIKMIQARELAGLDQVRRFQLEAEAAARLHHPAIVPIYEVGEAEGHHYYSMHYVDGQSLAEIIRQSVLAPRAAARMMLTICDAMEYAHQNGVIHRDLKPGNILLTESNPNLDSQAEPLSSRSEFKSSRSIDSSEDTRGRLFPLITDFGLAKQVRTDSDLTSTGQVVGTPNYMSPEQASGGAIGPACDVYGLGAVLYASLAGQPPFRAATMVDVLKQVVDKDPVSPRTLNSAIDKDLDTICMKCLRKDPAERYESAESLRSDLERFLNLEPIHARPVGLLTRSWRWCQRNPIVSSMGVLLMLILLTLAVAGPSIAVYQSQLRVEADQLVQVKNGLIGELQRSIQETESARRSAEVSADELHEHLVSMYIQRGNRELEHENPVAALPWYVEALIMDQDDPQRQWEHRIRLGAILRSAPRPRQIWQMPVFATAATISDDGKLIAAGGRGGDLVVWSTDLGEPVFGPKRTGRFDVSAVQFSDDNQFLLHATGRDVGIHDLTSGKLTTNVKRIDAPVRAAQMDASARWIAIGLRNGKVFLVDAESGKPVRFFRAHDDSVTCIDVDWKARRLLSCGADNMAQLFDLDSGELIASQEHGGRVTSCEFDPTGTRFVTSSDDGTARVFEAGSGKQLESLEHHERVRIARFDSDGKRIATGSYDASARIWDCQTGEMIVGPLEHELSIPSVAFSADGKYLVTASVDHTARIWDTATGERVSPSLQHGFVVTGARFFPADNRVMTMSDDGTVRTWELPFKPNLAAAVQHDTTAKSCRFSRDGKKLLTAGKDGTARVWESDTGKPTNVIVHHGGEVYHAEFSPDGKRFVTASEDGTAHVVKMPDRETPGGQVDEIVLEHDADVLHATFDGTGKWVLSGGEDGVARLWHADNGELAREWKQGKRVLWGTFNHDGSRVLTCSDDGTARVWDVRTGEAVTPPLEHDGRVESGEFSPDGDLVVTASNDYTSRVWEVASGKQFASFDHPAGVQTAVFTPDGSRVVTGARDGAARIWDVKRRSPVSPPLSVGRGLVRAVVSPDGRLIATSGGQAARLWDARSGRLLAADMRHTNWLTKVCFSPDSSRLASACDDGSVRVWQLPEPDLRSLDELAKLVGLISGQRADATDGLIPLDSDELATLRAQLKKERRTTD